jgi:hypothetical protein
MQLEEVLSSSSTVTLGAGFSDGLWRVSLGGLGTRSFCSAAASKASDDARRGREVDAARAAVESAEARGTAEEARSVARHEIAMIGMTRE